MVEAVGAMRGDEAIEAMLAEGLGALLASHPDIDLLATLGGALDVDGASSVATRVALTRRFGNVPEIRTALGAGRICYEAAELIARICGPMNVQAWIERATQRTVKQLREDVDVIELLARLEGRSPTKARPAR